MRQHTLSWCKGLHMGFYKHLLQRIVFSRPATGLGHERRGGS
jgi:hypothetical protein